LVDPITGELKYADPVEGEEPWAEGEKEAAEQELDNSPTARAQRLEELREVEARKIATQELEALSLREAGEKEAEAARLRQVEADKEHSRVQKQHEEQLERKRALRQEAEEEEARQLAETVAAEKARLEQQRQEEEEERQREAAAEAEREQEERRCRLQQAELEAATLAAAEDEATAEKRRKAEAQRKKREAFLSDVNTFSQTVEDDAQRATDRRQGDQSTAGMTDELNQLNEGFKPPASSEMFAETPLFETAFQPVTEPPPAPVEEAQDAAVRIGAGSSFDELTSSLFAANNSAANASAQANAHTADVSEKAETKSAESVSRLAAIGGGDLLPTQTQTHASASASAAQADNDDDDDNEEEGMGGDRSISNILTKAERQVLSPQQKAAWCALQVTALAPCYAVLSARHRTTPHCLLLLSIR
jgi:colicin import membrane protein